LIQNRNRALVRAGSHTALRYQWGAWKELREITGKNDVELAQTLLDANRVLILHNPLGFASAVAKASATCLFPYVTSLSTGGSGILHALWSGIHFLLFALCFVQVWVVSGHELLICILPTDARDSWWPEMSYETRLTYCSTIAVVLYTIAISCIVDVGDPRQRWPSDIFLFVNAMLGYRFLSRVGRCRCSGTE